MSLNEVTPSAVERAFVDVDFRDGGFCGLPGAGGGGGVDTDVKVEGPSPSPPTSVSLEGMVVEVEVATLEG